MNEEIQRIIFEKTGRMIDLREINKCLEIPLIRPLLLEKGIEEVLFEKNWYLYRPKRDGTPFDRVNSFIEMTKRFSSLNKKKRGYRFAVMNVHQWNDPTDTVFSFADIAREIKRLDADTIYLFNGIFPTGKNLRVSEMMTVVDFYSYLDRPVTKTSHDMMIVNRKFPGQLSIGPKVNTEGPSMVVGDQSNNFSSLLTFGFEEQFNYLRGNNVDGQRDCHIFVRNLPKEWKLYPSVHFSSVGRSMPLILDVEL